MEAFWISTGIVALAEIGDKTQLLALVLATRRRWRRSFWQQNTLTWSPWSLALRSA